MPFLRRRPLLRAAAVGGGAYMYGKHRAGVEEEQQEEAYAAGQQSAMAAAPPPAPAATGTSSDDIARLQDLGKLHEQGILTDEEFAQQKAKILGSRLGPRRSRPTTSHGQSNQLRVRPKLVLLADLCGHCELRALERVAPADQHVVDGGGSHDRVLRHRQRYRMQDERLGLRSAQSAVERDQLLERAALLELRVVEAVDHDVGHVFESIRPQQVGRRAR